MRRSFYYRSLCVLLVLTVLLSFSGSIPTQASWAGAPGQQTVIAKDTVSAEQRESINMLNYLCDFTWKITNSSDNVLFLCEAYDDFVNNTEPKSVTKETADFFRRISDAISGFESASLQAKNLQTAYEKMKAVEFMKAIPSANDVLTAFQRGSALESFISCLGIGLNSYAAYAEGMAELDVEYLNANCALDIETNQTLRAIRTEMFAYMTSVAQDLPAGYTLSEDMIKALRENEAQKNVASRITWLESHRNEYKNYGEYWLILARSYYERSLLEKSNAEELCESCLTAIAEYCRLNVQIFRKDKQLAETLAYGIAAARKCRENREYVGIAVKYAGLIVDNTGDKDWELRYFAANTYLDCYNLTKNDEYLQCAYSITLDNVNYLKNEQQRLNEAYRAEPELKTAEKGATGTQKQQIKEYNRRLKELRKTELAPIYEPLRLNCDLLAAMVTSHSRLQENGRSIDAILHDNGDPIFLNQMIDEKYWFESEPFRRPARVAMTKDGRLNISSSYVTENTKIRVKVKQGTAWITVEDWTLDSVARGSDPTAEQTDYTAIYTSQAAKKINYQDGDTISVILSERKDNGELVYTVTFKFHVKVTSKIWGAIKEVEIIRD